MNKYILPLNGLFVDSKHSNMKWVLMLTIAITLCFDAFSQNDGMGNHYGNSTGNYTFSLTEILLGAILLVLIIGGLIWLFNNAKK